MSSTVLIVDDEYAGRETLQSVLESEGYTLEMAENGQQAIEMAKRIMPDVILLDVMMPGMTGYEVCQHIRTDPQVAEIPIISLIAHYVTISKNLSTTCGSKCFPDCSLRNVRASSFFQAAR